MSKFLPPRLVRPIENEYKVIGKFLLEHNIYNLTDKQFLGIIMKESRGFMDPNRVKQIYDMLMIEAGIKDE